MAILNIQLNAISVVNLVMSIGIAIEFCVHIIYAFLVVLSICGPPSTSLLVENRNAPNEKQEHQVLNSATHSS
ncbi:hypothetical protein Sjap_017554 [Stephania japonica]